MHLDPAADFLLLDGLEAITLYKDAEHLAEILHARRKTIAVAGTQQLTFEFPKAEGPHPHVGDSIHAAGIVYPIVEVRERNPLLQRWYVVVRVPDTQRYPHTHWQG